MSEQTDMSPVGLNLTAGNSTWAYFMVSRPVLKFKSSSFEALRFAQLAQQFDFRFVLVDPLGHYAAAVASLPPELLSRISYLSADDWKREVKDPSTALPPEQVSVPEDGHFADGMNRLIAAAVARRISRPPDTRLADRRRE